MLLTVEVQVQRAVGDLGLVVIDALLLQPDAGLPSPVMRGILPVVGLVGLLAVFRWVLVTRFDAEPSEVVQAVFVLLFTSWVVLTAVGFWFRGPGMALTWPWGGGG